MPQSSSVLIACDAVTMKSSRLRPVKGKIITIITVNTQIKTHEETKRVNLNQSNRSLVENLDKVLLKPSEIGY